MPEINRLLFYKKATNMRKRSSYWNKTGYNKKKLGGKVPSFKKTFFMTGTSSLSCKIWSVHWFKQQSAMGWYRHLSNMQNHAYRWWFTICKRQGRWISHHLRKTNTRKFNWTAAYHSSQVKIARKPPRISNSCASSSRSSLYQLYFS